MSGLDFTPNQRRAVLAIAAVAVIALSVVFARNSMRGSDVVLREPGSGAQSSVIATDSDPIGGAASDGTGEVVVHVTGAVRYPNVYRLKPGQRVMDAIDAAGGALPGADLQSLNLAAKAQDGSQIVVPSANPAPTPGVSVNVQSIPAGSAGASGGGSSSEKLSTPGEGVVSINTAGSEELQRLPGVGPATAEKILEYRRQLGRFSRVEQLMDVSGIGPKKFEKMKPFVEL